MKKLIAGLMLLLMFVNVSYALKEVKPDAKTENLLKEKVKVCMDFIADLKWGFDLDNDGGKSDHYLCDGFWISIDSSGSLKNLAVSSLLPQTDDDVQNERQMRLWVWLNKVSGKPIYYSIDFVNPETLALLPQVNAFFDLEGKITKFYE